MKKIAVILSLLMLSFGPVSAIAADKVVVVPLNTSRIQQELVPLAHGEISSSSGAIASTGSYGISSTEVNGTGDVTVTLTTSWNGFPTIVTGSWGSSDTKRIVSYLAAYDGNTIRFRIKNSTSGALESGWFSFVVFGQKQ